MRKAKARALLAHGLCHCHWKPWESTGLEGFDEDFQYRFQLVADANDHKWYRVYPVELRTLQNGLGTVYFECIGLKQFERFFQVTWSPHCSVVLNRPYTLNFELVTLRFAAVIRTGVLNGRARRR